MLKRFVTENATNQGRHRGAQGVWQVADELIARLNLPTVRHFLWPTANTSAGRACGGCSEMVSHA